MSDDWVFDFALQFLESDKFDAAVMDFVDEKCDVFDAEDENKFIYSDIHRDFRDHIEALITSNLGELGITPQMFYESCERGRHHRDINRAVFERLLRCVDTLPSTAPLHPPCTLHTALPPALIAPSPSHRPPPSLTAPLSLSTPAWRTSTPSSASWSSATWSCRLRP